MIQSDIPYSSFVIVNFSTYGSFAVDDFVVCGIGVAIVVTLNGGFVVMGDVDSTETVVRVAADPVVTAVVDAVVEEAGSRGRRDVAVGVAGVVDDVQPLKKIAKITKAIATGKIFWYMAFRYAQITLFFLMVFDTVGISFRAKLNRQVIFKGSGAIGHD